MCFSNVLLKSTLKQYFLNPVLISSITKGVSSHSSLLSIDFVSKSQR